MNHFIQYLAKYGDSPVVTLEDACLCEKHRAEFKGEVLSTTTSVDPCDYCKDEEEQAFIAFGIRQRWLASFVHEGGGPIYIGGPMSSLPNYNKPSFWRMERLIKSTGQSVLSPAHYDKVYPYEWYMEEGIKMVLQSKACIFLIGWQDSQGARIEHDVASIIGRRIYYEL